MAATKPEQTAAYVGYTQSSTHTHTHYLTLRLSQTDMAQITLSAFGCNVFRCLPLAVRLGRREAPALYSDSAKRCLVSDYGRFVLSLCYIFDDVISKSASRQYSCCSGFMYMLFCLAQLTSWQPILVYCISMPLPWRSI